MVERAVRSNHATERGLPRPGTPERFIGQLGWAILFTDADQNPIATSYEMISRLGLTMGDRRLMPVKSIFSRLTQWVEMQAATGATVAPSEPGDSLRLSPELRALVTKGMAPFISAQRRVRPAQDGESKPRVEIVPQQKIGIGYDYFTGLFAEHLRAADSTVPGMSELAERLVLPTPQENS